MRRHCHFPEQIYYSILLISCACTYIGLSLIHFEFIQSYFLILFRFSRLVGCLNLSLDHFDFELKFFHFFVQQYLLLA